MTWNLAQTMSLIKAAQHKYTHRKLVGRDPKTNRPRYRYYYARHHGGGITSAAFEAGSAFKLTFKGRRGHFHIQRVEGNKVFVKHDGRPGSKEVEMSQDELRALLEKQHSELETKGREKAQKRRKSAAKKRKSTKRTKSTKRKKTQTQTPREEPTETTQQGADNFETMPEELPDEPFEMRIARENIGKVQARLQAEREKGKTEHQLTKLNMMLESAREDYAIELAEYRAERETAQQAPQRSQTTQAVAPKKAAKKATKKATKKAAKKATKKATKKAAKKATKKAAKKTTKKAAKKAAPQTPREQLIETAQAAAPKKTAPQTPAAPVISPQERTQIDTLKELYGDTLSIRRRPMDNGLVVKFPYRSSGDPENLAMDIRDRLWRRHKIDAGVWPDGETLEVTIYND